MRKPLYFLFFPQISILLFISSWLLPFLGSFLCFVFFLPLLFAYYSLEKRNFLLSFLISLLIFIFFPKLFPLYITALLIFVFPLIWGIKKYSSHGRRIIFILCLSFILGGIIATPFCIFNKARITNIITYIQEQTKKTEEDLIKNYEKKGISGDEIERLKILLKKVEKLVFNLMPSMFLLVMGGSIFIHYYFLSKFLYFHNLEKEAFPGPENWRLPFFIVWIFILSSFLLFLSRNISPQYIFLLSINLVFLSVSLILLEGLGILHFFLLKVKCPWILMIFVYFIVLLQPLFIALLFLFGLLDFWIDFRKISSKKSQVM